MPPDSRPAFPALPGPNPPAGPIRTPPSREDSALAASKARPRHPPGPRRYLQGHGLRRAGREAQAVPGPQEEPIEVGLAVEETEEDAQEFLHVADMLQDAQKCLVVHVSERGLHGGPGPAVTATGSAVLPVRPEPAPRIWIPALWEAPPASLRVPRHSRPPLAPLGPPVGSQHPERDTQTPRSRARLCLLCPRPPLPSPFPTLSPQGT